MTITDFEIMAPVGSRESLAAALQAGADSIYFGVEQLNMRAHSASKFTIADLRDIAAQCSEKGVKTYLTVNVIVYDEELETMRQICRAAKEAGISAIIASDPAVLLYCKEIGQEVHLSTQLNITNFESLRFYSAFADVAVLAREVNLRQVRHIYDRIQQENLCGPGGKQMRIEMFCHGALCMAVSGKCYLSLDNMGRSANRGECMQQCRRSYTVKDRETGVELDIDNKYIMSPKDLKTIAFLDQMMAAGVRVFKIEGRARSAEYVYTVVTCYKEAIAAALDGTFSEEKVNGWNERLATVFNRGFWDGYYQGQKLGEWTPTYGSSATEKKVYAGKVTKYFSKIGVAEILVEASEIAQGEKLLAIGTTTGALYFPADEIRLDGAGAVEKAEKGALISIATPDRVRPGDKIYRVVKEEANLLRLRPEK